MNKLLYLNRSGNLYINSRLKQCDIIIYDNPIKWIEIIPKNGRYKYFFKLNTLEYAGEGIDFFRCYIQPYKNTHKPLSKQNINIVKKYLMENPDIMQIREMYPDSINEDSPRINLYGFQTKFVEIIFNTEIILFTGNCYNISITSEFMNIPVLHILETTNEELFNNESLYIMSNGNLKFFDGKELDNTTYGKLLYFIKNNYDESPECNLYDFILSQWLNMYKESFGKDYKEEM